MKRAETSSSFERWRAAMVVVLGLASGAALEARGSAPEVGHIQHYDVGRLRREAESGRPFRLPVGNLDCRVRVSPRVLRSDRFRAWAVNRDGPRPFIPRQAATYRGEVVGEPGSIVRLSFNKRGLAAFLRIGDEVHFIEPLEAESGAGGGSRPSVPHLTLRADERALGFHGTCGTLVVSPDAAAETAGESPLVERLQRAEGEIVVLEIAVDADFEYFQIHGADTTAEIEETLNIVEGIYEAELGIVFEITAVNVYEEDVDPYTSVRAEELLRELQFHWNTAKAGEPRDVVHLITGKDLEGSTIGIAFVGEVCDLAAAYGLSQGLSNNGLTPLVVAHEIGHNLGAVHDRSSDPEYIMNSRLSPSTIQEFSEQSKQDIEDYISLSSADCLGIEAQSDDGSSPRDGGGPVDPLLVVILLAGATALERARREVRRR